MTTLSEADRDALAIALKDEWQGGEYGRTAWSELPEALRTHWRNEVDYLPVVEILDRHVAACVAIHEGIRAQAVREASAEAWDEGYMRCSDDFERHANGQQVSADPLAASPYRAALAESAGGA